MIKYCKKEKNLLLAFVVIPIVLSLVFGALPAFHDDKEYSDPLIGFLIYWFFSSIIVVSLGWLSFYILNELNSYNVISCFFLGGVMGVLFLVFLTSGRVFITSPQALVWAAGLGSIVGLAFIFLTRVKIVYQKHDT